MNLLLCSYRRYKVIGTVLQLSAETLNGVGVLEDVFEVPNGVLFR